MLFGSFERFICLLIDHFNGAFPLWLAPVQIKILSVAEKHLAFAEKLVTEFKANGFRVEVDHNNETVGNKIRKAVNEKVPYVLVIGDKEMKSQDLNVRDRGQQETRTIAKDAFIAELQEKIKNHS